MSPKVKATVVQLPNDSEEGAWVAVDLSRQGEQKDKKANANKVKSAFFDPSVTAPSDIAAGRCIKGKVATD